MNSTSTEGTIAGLAAAQQASDPEALDALLADDFVLVGPLGFVLDKQQWLEQWQAGNLSFTRLVIEDVSTRFYGDVTVAVGVQDQQGSYRDQPADGRFRVTLILDAAGGSERIVGAHLSPIATPGPPAGSG